MTTSKDRGRDKPKPTATTTPKYITRTLSLRWDVDARLRELAIRYGSPNKALIVLLKL